MERQVEKSKEAESAKANQEDASVPSAAILKPMSSEVQALFRPSVPSRQLTYRLLGDEERTKPICAAEKEVFFKPFQKAKILISTVTDLNDFYVIREEDVENVAAINEGLNTAATFGLSPYHPMRKQVPIACALDDASQWSRIKVLKVEPVENSRNYDVHVRFIDSGREEILAPTDIRAVPDWLLAKPQLAYHCSLVIRPVDYTYKGESQAYEGSWAPTIIDTLRNLGKYSTAEEQTAHLGLELHCFRAENGFSLVDLKLVARPTTWTTTLVEYGAATWMNGLGLGCETDAKDDTAATETSEDAI